MLQFRPGTDVALLNALLHTVIVTEGLVTRLRAAAHATTRRARSTSWGCSPRPWRRSAASAAHHPRGGARAYAGAGAMILWGMGVSQHVHGTDNARCLIALCAVTGQIGRPALACTRCAARTTCRAPATPA